MKILALAIALVSFSAVADEHHKHMVTIEGWDQGVQDRSLDLSYSSGDEKDEVESRNIALNYAYALNNTWQIGGLYKSFLNEVDGKVTAAGDEVVTYGVFGIYNFAGKLTDTNYLALGYTMSESEDSNLAGKDGVEATEWNLEFGHRFSLGHLWNMDFNWSPSIELTRTTVEDDAITGSDDEVTTLAVGLNVIKVDVLF